MSRDVEAKRTKFSGDVNEETEDGFVFIGGGGDRSTWRQSRESCRESFSGSSSVYGSDSGRDECGIREGGTEAVHSSVGNYMDMLFAEKDVEVARNVHHEEHRIDGPVFEEILYESDDQMEQTHGHFQHETSPSIEEMFMGGFLRQPLRRKILHDIYPIGNDTEADRDIQAMLRSSFQGTVFIVCRHGDHFHVVHDCSWNSNTCRCARIQIIKRGRKCNRRIVWAYEFSSAHWRNLTVYFESGERSIIQMEVAGRVWYNLSKTGDLQLRKVSGARPEELLERSRDSEYVLDYVNCRPKTNDGGQTSQSSSQGSDGSKRNRKRNQGDELVEFVLQFPTAPLNNIFNLPEWNKSKWRYMPKSSQFLKTCMGIVQRKYCEMNIVDYRNLFERAKRNTFNSPNGHAAEYYYDVDYSFTILNALINFQFNNNYNACRNFMKDVFDICEKNRPKCNALFVLSAPNAGKNYFFDAILHFYCNFGQIGNFNKFCSFPLQEAVNKRILLWNEPQCEPSAFEDLKMLLGGDTMNAKVKHQDDAVLSRTPIIILSNNDVFPKNEAFRTRMICHQWKPCEELREFSKKPSPLCYLKLLDHYGVGFANVNNDTDSETE